jgi:acetyl-CoA synthetase
MSQAHHIAKLLPAKSNIALDQYKELHQQSIDDPETFWGKAAKEHLDWFRPFDKVLDGSFEHGDVRWFEGGKLNLSYNALDRQIDNKQSNDIALVWEGDEPDDIRKLTYEEVLRKVCQIANALLRMGVKKGDIVTIYMPMIPE